MALNSATISKQEYILKRINCMGRFEEGDHHYSSSRWAHAKKNVDAQTELPIL